MTDELKLNFFVYCRLIHVLFLLSFHFWVFKDRRLDIKKIDECMGNPDADVDHPILKSDQETQVSLLLF